MTFQEDVRRGHENVRRRVIQAIRRISIEAANDVISISPVDTGRFRGNWQSSINTPNFAINDALDPSGQASLLEAEFVISGFNEGDVYFPVSYTHLTLPTIYSV